jgi:L-amino acid N-acyltransferase YncA
MTTPILHLSHGPDLIERSYKLGLPRPETLAKCDESPDARIYLTSTDDCVIAYAALWWQNTPQLMQSQLGAIGGFAANDQESAKLLLDGAINFLKQMGCKIAVGPMNGNTWRQYRWVTECSGRPPFFMEPSNALTLPQWWQQSGFSLLSSYTSSILSLENQTTISNGVRLRIERTGVKIRPFNLSNFDDELEKIYQVSILSFQQNSLYTPIVQKAFMSAYEKIKNQIDPNLIWLAERDGIACGFAFGIPDIKAQQRDEKPALIVKTLAVDPTANCPGLGSLLIDRLHEAARKCGFSEAIHALQHESNSSLKITGRHQGIVIRRYGLFSKEL